ncbi:MAG: amino acid adenylation domain-containing protein [Burkholderiaceae bacterium]
MWRELIGSEPDAGDDNYFGLGGQSIDAVRLAARVRAAFGIDLPPIAVFEKPTLSGYADLVAQARTAAALVDEPARADPQEPLAMDSRQRLAGRLRALRGVPRPGTRRGPSRLGLRAGELPATPSQRAMWLIDAMGEGGRAYAVAHRVDIDGPIDVAALGRALQSLTERHDALRMALVARDGEPCLVLHERADLPLEVDAASFDAKGVAAIEREFAGLRFDLAAAPLARARLLRRDDSRHVLLLAMHHAITDGWSIGLLMHELGAAYERESAGLATPAMVEGPGFADYVAWLHAQADEPPAQASLSYWRERLGGLATLAMPTDRPRPPHAGGAAGLARLSIPRSLAHKVDATARRHGATRFMVLLAAFQALLSRYTGQTDIAVGTPVSGRSLPALESIVGYFANMVVMRADLSDGSDFATLVDRTRVAALEATRHQDTPFERVVAALAPERIAGMNPLFQVSFALQNFPKQALSLGAARCTLSSLDGSIAQFDLSMTLSESSDGLDGEIEFATALFDADRIERMALHYVRFLDLALDDPQVPLETLDYLGTDEADRIIRDWNDTSRSYSRDSTLAELFAARAACVPTATAIVDGRHSIDYRELDARANRLARQLRDVGVDREALVALCLPRGIDLLVAMLGTWKAGAAYLPLDPTQPPARLDALISDARVRVLLGSASTLSALSPPTGAACVEIDTDAEAIRARGGGAVRTSASATDLAYVIYTSGSTGEPKGVAIEHRSLCNHTEWLVSEFGIEAGERFLWRTAPTFDASGVEIWPALLAGATVVVADDEIARDPCALLELLESQQVSRAQFVPGLLGAMLEQPSLPSASLALRTLFVGGDVLARVDVERWQALTGVPVVNLYGPTECTVDSTSYRCATRLADGPIGVGRPIANARVYVLDRNRRPVPVGIDGEIYIAGDLLARGYLGRPDLTAERFVIDPFASAPGERMYRSGDQGRWRKDGTIEYRGRVDRQLKLRGFRIEPAEIESVCLAAGARGAVVRVRPDTGGKPRLECFVEPESIDTLTLRAQLAARLPAYMVPSSVTALACLPRLANGKVDRDAIPAADSAASLGAHESPCTETESRVAQIWRSLLGVELIGRLDDFFALGGDSLGAARMVARLEAQTGVRVPLREVYEDARLSAVAERVERIATRPGVDPRPSAAGPGPDERSDLDRRPGDTGRATPAAAPATSSQAALWYVEALTGANRSYQIVEMFRIVGALDTAALGHALASVAARHEAMRAEFAVSDDVLTMRVDDALEPSLQRIAASELAAFATAPFDLTRAPLWRAGIARDADGSHVFVLAMHHIVTDGWSMAILRRELSQAYDAASKGHMPLPDPPGAGYLEYLRRMAARADAGASLSYWRERLRGVEPIALPTDRPRPLQRTHAGEIVRFEMGRASVEASRSLARRHRASLYMVLLAAWQIVLSRHSGSHDISVGSPVAGRYEHELEALVGYFTNMVVVRSDLAGNPEFADLLSRVRQRVLEAFEHQDIAFDRLVETLRPVREPGANPVFQVAFALQNQPEAPLALGDLDCTPLAAVARQSKFDLSMSLTDTEGRLAGVLEYATELFDRSRIERLVSHFEHVLEQVARDERIPLGEIALDDPVERARLARWSRGVRFDFPADETLAALFDAQVKRAPDALAIVDGGCSLTYAELDAQANRLAHWLREQDARPGATVAVGLERGVKMLVAILASVKAGAAYLPLDIRYPVARLHAMLTDALPVALITDGPTADAMMGAGAGPGSLASDDAACLPAMAVLRVDVDDDLIDGFPAHAPGRLGSGRDPAYLMYTSGSTGASKGVTVPQMAVTRLVVGTDYVSIGPDDGVAQAASIAFDAATFEIWGAWLNGARLILVGPDTVLSATALRALIRSGDVSTMFLTTSLFNAHASVDPSMFAPLKTLLFGGEAADAAVLGRVLESGGAPRCLLNGYGPTETTTFATTWRVPTDASVLAREAVLGVPIGRPIANTDCMVLDADGRQQPIGVVGELVIGGPGVALGYRNNEALTAERFVPDPDGPPGALRYRTGDLVRWRDDGQLLFVGRRDEQVKIRGFRIETGEIVSALRAHPDVGDASVLVVDRPPAGRELVAFVVPRSERDRASAALREYLRSQLPEFMVPAKIRYVDAMPITANGKLDRDALLACLDRHGPGAPASDSDSDSARKDRPRGDAELDADGRRVLAIWRRTLDAPDLGPDDHFFESGGHSLLALRMLGVVEREFGRVMRVGELFQAPTARRFAARLRDDVLADPGGCAVVVQAGGELAPLFVVTGYGGEVVAFRELAHRLGADQPLVVLDTSAFDPQRTAGMDLKAIAARMAADMRRIQPHGPYRLCGYSLGGRFVFEIARRLELDGERVGLLAMLDANAPGYPRRRPILARIGLHLQNLGRQSAAENLAYVLERLEGIVRGRRLAVGALDGPDSSTIKAVAASAESMYAKWRDYVPEGGYGGPLLIVRAVVRNALPRMIDDDPQLGWGHFAYGEIEVAEFPGSHHDLRDPGHAAVLARILSPYLGAPTKPVLAGVSGRGIASPSNPAHPGTKAHEAQLEHG